MLRIDFSITSDKGHDDILKMMLDSFSEIRKELTLT